MRALGRDPPVRDGRDEDRDVSRHRRLDGTEHLGGGLDVANRDPAGSGTVTGPDTSVTLAPASWSASAMAWPCRPEERLAM